MDEVYEPREDSFLLEKYVKEFAKGLCLDMGTGSGIQTQAAARNSDFVIAVDINQNALRHCNDVINSDKILCIESDLFDFFEKKFIVIKNGVFKGIKDRIGERNRFDTVIFNPPYLPIDEKDKDIALDGGEDGHEIIRSFLEKSRDYLSKDGIILLIFSSFTGKQKVDSLIIENGLNFEELSKEHIFFEDIYCYKIRWK